MFTLMSVALATIVLSFAIVVVCSVSIFVFGEDGNGLCVAGILLAGMAMMAMVVAVIDDVRITRREDREKYEIGKAVLGLLDSDNPALKAKKLSKAGKEAFRQARLQPEKERHWIVEQDEKRYRELSDLAYCNAISNFELQELHSIERRMEIHHRSLKLPK